MVEALYLGNGTQKSSIPIDGFAAQTTPTGAIRRTGAMQTLWTEWTGWTEWTEWPTLPERFQKAQTDSRGLFIVCGSPGVAERRLGIAP